MPVWDLDHKQPRICTHSDDCCFPAPLQYAQAGLMLSLHCGMRDTEETRADQPGASPLNISRATHQGSERTMNEPTPSQDPQLTRDSQPATNVDA